MSVCSSFGRVWLCVTPWTEAHQASLSMEFSRQEYWSRLPFPSPGDGTWVALAGGFFAVWAMRKAHRKIHRTYQNYLGYFPGSLVAKTSHPSCRWPRVHMLLLRVCMSQCREISSATTKTQHSQIKNIYIYIYKKTKQNPGGLAVKNLPANSGTQRDPTCHGATEPVHLNYWSPRVYNPRSTIREATAMSLHIARKSSSPAHCK